MDLPDSFPPIDLPDLGDLRPLAAWFGILRVLSGSGSDDRVAYGLQANSIRLCQAAISEYQLGQAAIRSFHATLGGLTPLHWLVVSIRHFESMLWHLERFIKHAKALRSACTAEIDLKHLIPRQLAFFQDKAESRISKLRHSIAHLEQDIQNSKFPEGESMMLRPTRRGLELGAECIEWAELEAWLREAYEVSSKLVEFSPNAEKGP